MNRELRERLAARKRHFPTSEHLWAAYQCSRDAILDELHRHWPDAEVLNWGPDRDARSDTWSVIIKVGTDEAKAAIAGDDLLIQRLRTAAQQRGFAPDTIEIESVETVTRVYRGDWFLRWKA